MPPVPVPLLGIPQKPRNISKNRGYPAIVHICPQMSGCYPHQCGQLCGKLGITPGERADNPESMPRRGKRGLSQKVRRIPAFWSLQNEVKIRAAVWRLQKWKTRFLGDQSPKNRRSARKMRGVGGAACTELWGAGYSTRKRLCGSNPSGDASLPDYVFLIASRGGNVGALPQTPQGGVAP